ncbi:MAG: ferredoxin [Rhodospirillales bacterium]|nr:ferredoxin [Rhodospirillales bacterium]
MTLDSITTACVAHGLITRGGFHPGPADGVPGDPATLVLIGNAGAKMWRAFEKDRADEADPLDAWTRRVVSAIATDLGANPLFPFDGPPYLPFQRWAMKAEPVYASPIGPLIHPEYGLWHAYRGALALEQKLDLPEPKSAASPCAACADKPCLSTCPVNALTPGGYDVPACVSHIDGPDGADCLDLGCRARRACPIGRDYIYAPAQARFHMDHFRRANRRC